MRYLALALSLVVFLLQSCASTPPEHTLKPIADKLIGKSQAELLQCAGQPLHRTTHGQEVVLRYYKEAPMFEESRPFLKGSQPGVHHGCWASVLLDKDSVVGITFRTVPEESEQHGDECEEIFQACAP